MAYGQCGNGICKFCFITVVLLQVVQARMIGMNEEGIPMIHLYRANNGQTVMINRELVDR